MSDGAAITAKIRAIRRMQFGTLFVSSAAIVVPSLAALALLSTFANSSPLLRTAALLLGATAPVAAALLALLRMPPWRDTAKLVDRTMGLDQRVETACDLLDSDEEIDRLLLKDTCRRLMPVRPAEVSPIRMDRTARIALPAGIIAFAGLGILRLLWEWQGPALRSQAGGPQIADGAPTAPGAARSPHRTNAPTAVATADPTRPVVTSAPGRAAAPQEPRLSRPTAQAATPAPARALSTKTDETAGPAEVKPPPDRGSGHSGGPERSSSGGVGKPQTGKSTGRAGSAGVTPARADVGGVPAGGAPGQTTARRAVMPIDAALLARHPARYPAYPAAEEPFAKETIPPGLRKYVADYFTAIRP